MKIPCCDKCGASCEPHTFRPMPDADEITVYGFTCHCYDPPRDVFRKFNRAWRATAGRS